MHACENADRVCPIHKAGTDRVRSAYSSILMQNWSKKDIARIMDFTTRVMLEDPCPTCPVLDDMDQDTLARAELEGRSYADQAKAYIHMLYDAS
jgi:hypothetical protein